MGRTVIPLDTSHAEAATVTLAAAFANDPAMSWLFPDRTVRERRLPGLMRWSFEDHLRHGMVLGTPDCSVVTLWRPPGTVHAHTRLTLPAMMRFLAMLGTAVQRAELLDRKIEQHLPAGEAQYYLRMAAVRPDRQGQGLGGLAIRAGLARAAAAGLPATLETAKDSNVGLYRSLGFEVLTTWRATSKAPQFWTMECASAVS